MTFNSFSNAQFNEAHLASNWCLIYDRATPTQLALLSSEEHATLDAWFPNEE